MNEKFIPLSVPNFSGNEKKYTQDAVVSEWVSTGGSLVANFEKAIAGYVKMPAATACNSGTAGLHLAFIVAGIGTGMEVLAPALTFVAATNPIKYVGAQPVFIGCDDSLCIDPLAVAAFCENNCELKNGKLYNKKSGAHVAALEVVHVFGNLADMPALMRIAKKYNLVLVEDATESLGSFFTSGEFEGKMSGTIGDIGVYSFNGNKLITTGSGGMLVSNHPQWTAHAKHLSTQAKTDELHFIHDEIGYNYRLTNLQAALGLAQMEQIEQFIAHKHTLYDFYFNTLKEKNGVRLLPFKVDTRPNKWFFSLYLEDPRHNRDAVIAKLSAQKIQVRPVWELIPHLAAYKYCEAYSLETAQDMRNKIINIPCSTNLSLEDAKIVSDAILAL